MQCEGNEQDYGRTDRGPGPICRPDGNTGSCTEPAPDSLSSGRSGRLLASHMRIISLCPSLTELVFDLGRGDDVVGVTRYCVHPQEVLLNREENRLEDAEALKAAGLRCHISMPRNLSETAEMVRSIGDAVERAEEGERIAKEIEKRGARVRREAEDLALVPFAYVIWSKPWLAVGADTFAHSLLAQAGGVNVFGDRPERYPEITSKQLAEADPDLVLLCTEPFPFRDSHVEELSRDTGLAAERLRIADGEYLSWHGSRTPEGIDYAARLIQSARAPLPTTRR